MNNIDEHVIYCNTRITIVLLYPVTKVLTQFYINLINLSVDIF